MILSVDDGCASDMRIAELASKYEIPCVFYWPVEWHSLAYDNGYKPLDYEQALQIAQSNEIGSHTITHRHLTKIPLVEALKEIIGSKFMLQRMFNREVRKFCPPRGYTTQELSDTTLNFYQSQRLTKGEGLVHIHPDSGANDNVPWEVAAIRARGPSPPFNDIELWGHSWEFDKYNLWDELESYLKGLT